MVVCVPAQPIGCYPAGHPDDRGRHFARHRRDGRGRSGAADHGAGAGDFAADAQRAD